MEAAFNRLDITDAKYKFSHIDEKIPSDSDPIINDFMCGPQNNDTWKAFVDYLRQKHGKTTKERAYSVIDGTEREGRMPSQLWSIMMDKQGKIGLDDVQKEQLLRRLPQDVQRHLETKGIAGKTGKEVAEMADIYYDKSGKLKNASTVSGINAVRSTLPSAMKTSDTPSNTSSTRHPEATGFTAAFVEDASDVNAVRFKQGQRQRVDVSNGSSYNQRNRSQSRGRHNNNNNNNNNNNGGTSENRYSNNGGRFSNNNNNNNRSSSKPNNKVCFYHITYGEKASKCEEGCMLFASHSAKGQASR